MIIYVIWNEHSGTLLQLRIHKAQDKWNAATYMNVKEIETIAFESFRNTQAHIERVM